MIKAELTFDRRLCNMVIPEDLDGSVPSFKRGADPGSRAGRERAAEGFDRIWSLGVPFRDRQETRREVGVRQRLVEVKRLVLAALLRLLACRAIFLGPCPNGVGVLFLNRLESLGALRGGRRPLVLGSYGCQRK